MLRKELLEEIGFLTKQNHLYYNEGDSEVSDAEFDRRKDALLDILVKVDPKNPFITGVGSVNIDKTPWNVLKHEYPLGSLSKVQKSEEGGELDKWYKSKFGKKLVVQEKLDGISISLVYEKGKLVSATTRGDGHKGEEIIRNIERIKNLPKEIEFQDKLAVRGEIILKHSVFEKYNLPFKNARNATAGIAKRFDGAYSNLLSIQAYTLMNAKDFQDITTEMEAIDFLKDQGFEIVNSYELTLTEIYKLYDKYVKSIRASLDWDIDGIVIKSNDIHWVNFDFDANDWKRPKNQIAFKFPHEETTSVIIDIEASIEGDIICPVAIIEPVDLCGVTISRASLANWKLAAEQNMGIGSTVLVSRRNDVIPKIEKVLIKGQALEIPTHCPVCNTPVNYDTNEAGEELSYLVCPNQNCKRKLVNNIRKWLGAHEVKNIGDSIINDLVDNNLVDSLESFLKVPYNTAIHDTLKGYGGYGTRKLNIIVKGIESTFKTNVLNVIAGMNFKNFSKNRAETILKASKAKTLQDFLDFVFSKEIFSVEGFGNETIKTLRKQITLKDDSLQAIIDLVKVDDSQLADGGPLEGMAFCITGELYTMSRPKAQELVKAYGGKASSSVSKKTTYLVSNDTTSTTGKMKKARGLGVPIITEEEFLKFINKSDLLVDKPEVKDIVSNTDPVDGFDDLLDDLNDLDDSNSDTDNVVSDIMDL